MIESHARNVHTRGVYDAGDRYRLYPVKDMLTISAIEQDLDTFSQRIDVLGFPDERVPFF